MKKQFLPRLLQVVCLVVCASGFSAGVRAQADATSRSWNQPFPPFRIAGNIYYTGASGVTAFLVTTPEGHILLDGGFVETAPLIERNLQTLGFELSEVKILLNSHAHNDHAGGLAALKAKSGARMIASAEDAVQLERGGKGDFAWGDTMLFPPVKVDAQVRNGETVRLGGTTLTAMLTPGHTKGCTSWTMNVQEGGRTLRVVFVCSVTVPGYTLVNNPRYPNIVKDYQRSFRALRAYPADIFLAPHAGFFSLSEKKAKLDAKPAVNPFIDPAGYGAYLNRNEADFRRIVAEQKKATKR